MTSLIFNPSFHEFHQEEISNNSPIEIEPNGAISNKKDYEVIHNSLRQFTTSGFTSSMHKKDLTNSHEI